MQINEVPGLNLEDADRRFPLLEWIVHGKLPPDKTEA
jgi:hypothetical protein